ncbi:MAG: FtsX-like permease family protein, partial [Bacteroidales bacterium]|nr:FtsX-like permease family protein [Bacteroidales bacterium]
QIFGWLDLLDMNVWLILALMIFVSGFNMISSLLILILERTNLIGMLKAMGANNLSLRKVFLWLSTMLTLRGMFWGNVIGLGLCALQYFFHLIPLDAAVYYVSSVPVEFNFFLIILLNLGVAFASFLMMLLPSGLVSRIAPVKAIRFD